MAYDMDSLVAKLKERGLDVAEDLAKELVLMVMDWVAEEAVKSENKYDDLALALIPVLKPLVMEQLDKIDGKVDEPQ